MTHRFTIRPIIKKALSKLERQARSLSQEEIQQSLLQIQRYEQYLIQAHGELTAADKLFSIEHMAAELDCAKKAIQLAITINNIKPTIDILDLYTPGDFELVKLSLRDYLINRYENTMHKQNLKDIIKASQPTIKMPDR